MRFSLENALGIYQHGVKVHEKRAEVLANNIANADTPGFKAKDIDFKDVLSSLNDIRKQNTGSTGDISSLMSSLEALERKQAQPSADGNTVDSSAEQMIFTENAVRYKTNLSMLDSRIKGIMQALKGE